MPINPDAIGVRSDPAESSWSSRDALIYALGIGAGTGELAFTTENSIGIEQRVFPTMAVTLARLEGAFSKIGTFNPAMLVHGEQRIELAGEIPTSGTASTVAEITGIFDKGKGAVVEITARSTVDGELLFTNVFKAFIRGEGGWGGDRGPSGPHNEAPARGADHAVTYRVGPDQALLYRLSGDRNPLHSDPQFAAMAGFDRPILHGLCTYGFTGRALLHELVGSDPARFRSMEGRFSSPVYPGEQLTIRMWDDGDGAALFRTHGEDDRVVLDAGRVTFDAA